jgi:hypothetical protein
MDPERLTITGPGMLNTFWLTRQSVRELLEFIAEYITLDEKMAVKELMGVVNEQQKKR